ncbi:hypothetical protein LCGC14_0534800 [marine sediment metagenome]|uniref:Uncharacterized protein n=1 Tax=marine sediment metagenome TaxID=412755 RepID=A0A0F9RZ97_9ZZZZ
MKSKTYDKFLDKIMGVKELEDGMCKCGHETYYHRLLSENQCHLMDCKCKRFEGQR